MLTEINLLKRQVVDLLAAYAKDLPQDYAAFMTSAHVFFQFNQPTDGDIHREYFHLAMAHSAVDALQATDIDDDLLDDAHRILHDIHAILLEAAESADETLGGTLDDDAVEEDGLIEAHAEDFAKWAEQLKHKE